MTSWRDFVVREDLTIGECLEILEKNEPKIVLLVDKDFKLKGTLTDGDIRRGLINGLNLSNLCLELMNSNPIVSNINYDFQDIKVSMEKLSINCVPIIDDFGFLVGSVFANAHVLGELTNVRVLVMAGGKGVRLRTLNSNLPKPLIEVSGRSMLDILLNKLELQGFTKITISLNHMAEKIIDQIKVDKYPELEIQYCIEDLPLGTAGSLISLSKICKEDTILVCHPDNVHNINLNSQINLHNVLRNQVSIVAKNYDLQIQYGVIHEENNRFDYIDEKPIYNLPIFTGITIHNTSVIKKLNLTGKIDMPELLNYASQKGMNIGVLKVDSFWDDLGTPERLENVKQETKILKTLK